MRLVLASGDAVELDGRAVVLGSDEACDVPLGGAAARHARIDGEHLEALVECHVGEVKLAPGERRRLVPGCGVELGGARLRVEGAEESSSRFTTRELALRAVAEPKRLWPTVVVVQGADAGAELVLRDERAFVIGRGATSDLALEDADASRGHAEIIRAGATILVRDLGSTRGTYLGRSRLDPNRRAVWSPEVMVRIGKTVLALVVPAWSQDTDHADTPSPIPAQAPQPAPASDPAPSSIPLSLAAGRTAAIAEVPVAAPPATTGPSSAGSAGGAPRALDRAVIGVVFAVVAAGLAALVWILWP